MKEFNNTRLYEANKEKIDKHVGKVGRIIPSNDLNY